MSFSSRASTPSASPATSPSSKSVVSRITSPTATRNASMHAHDFSSCTLRKHSFDTPSAYVSDEDLFGDDDLQYLSEPPAPPRPAQAFLARPLLPPVTQPRQRSSSSYQKTKLKHKLSFKG